MTELNGSTHIVKGEYMAFYMVRLMVIVYCLIVLNSKQFSISDTSLFTPYQHGGIASQIKTSAVINFVCVTVPFSDMYNCPSCCVEWSQ